MISSMTWIKIALLTLLGWWVVYSIRLVYGIDVATMIGIVLGILVGMTAFALIEYDLQD